MIDNEGHIIHIDYGFLLSNAPGKGLKFEKAPLQVNRGICERSEGHKNEEVPSFQESNENVITFN